MGVTEEPRFMEAGWTSPPAPPSTQSRRALVIEVIVVFLITLGGSTMAAIIGLFEELNTTSSTASFFIVDVPGQSVLSTVISCAYLLVRALGAVLLVWWVLHRAGESLATIGLTWRRFAVVAVLVLPFYALSTNLEHIGIQFHNPALTHSAYLHGPATAPAVYAVSAIARALEAGVVEEVVVLGFVVTRLRQAGLPTFMVLLISATLRASYHLEYGFAALGPFFFGIGMGIMYVASGKLVPAIVAHAAYDVVVSFQDYVFV